MSASTRYFDSLQEANNHLFSILPKQIHCAIPLGLGKPNQLVNLIYNTAKNDSSIKLKISTALSLEVPHPKAKLEKNFIHPYSKRHFGEDYPELHYTQDTKARKIPDNISVHEFYIQAAQNINIPTSQRNYTSLNYTHVAQNLFDDNLQVIVQLVAAKTENGKTTYSLSCNPDLTLDLVDLFKLHKKKLVMVGVVHPTLPYIGGDAEVESDFFDVVVVSPEVKHKLFALPQMPLEPADYLIGLYASQFLKDDGTIQIGIGSLSDAIVHATVLRQKDNFFYQDIIQKLWGAKVKPKVNLYVDKFVTGLYGTSEMVTDAFMHLRQAGVLTREIYDLDENKKRYLHGAFYLGSEKFYKWLCELSEEDRLGFSMTRVSKVNDLYDHHEWALRRQRKNACFFNTCMTVDLLGGAAADTLPTGQVISGVGGQYNFVAMSHELPDSRSILMLRSTHNKNGKITSSIGWGFAHLTIPRHLRDVVITEYGIANLRGRTDEDVICALIEISDSKFQDDLVKTAKKYGKIRQSYQIPEWAKQNTPENLKKFMKQFKPGTFPAFPFGTDFTPDEQKLVLALTQLKQAQSKPLLVAQTFIRGLKHGQGSSFQSAVQRMSLNKPRSVADWVYKNLVIGALSLLTDEI